MMSLLNHCHGEKRCIYMKELYKHNDATCHAPILPLTVCPTTTRHKAGTAHSDNVSRQHRQHVSLWDTPPCRFLKDMPPLNKTTINIRETNNN